MKNIKIALQDGTEFLTEVETFNLAQIVSELNDRTSGDYIVIGDVGMNKHVIRYFGEVDKVSNSTL